MLVKKFMLSFAVLAITSLGFAQTSVEALMRQQQEAASTRAQGTAQAAPRSPFATANCLSRSPPGIVLLS
jgi:invasion protein IalB